VLGPSESPYLPCFLFLLHPEDLSLFLALIILLFNVVVVARVCLLAVVIFVVFALIAGNR